MPNPNEEKMQELQSMEQNLQLMLNQKQTFQAQLLEVDNALSELEKTQHQVYKIIGTIMVASNKQQTIKELEERKNILELRIKTIEKQENNIKQKANKLQEELLKEMKS